MCGDKITDSDMFERTFTIFHKDNLILMQQYRERKFEKYYNLLSCLLVAEQNSELFLKNHNSRPTRSAAMFEAHATSSQKGGKKIGMGRTKILVQTKTLLGTKIMVDSADLNPNTKAKAKQNLRIPRRGMKMRMNHLISLKRTMKLNASNVT